MNVEDAYYQGANSFRLWTRLVESHTRGMQAKDSSRADSHALIISAPTDCGIPLLAAANRTAETSLLCFSDRTGRIGTGYCLKHGCKDVNVTVAPFFHIPFCDAYFSIVFANCFLDFCPESELKPVLDEIRRVLEMGGSLFTVNMAGAPTIRARIWLWLLRRLSRVAEGLHPIDPARQIGQRGFHILNDRSVSRFGFPMQYTQAEKIA